MRTERRGGRRCGFTLTEVMVALLILALGVASVTLFGIWLMRATGFAGDVSTGMALAESKLEQMRASRLSQLTPGTDTVARFSRVWTVSDDGSMKRIDVSVRWQDVGGNAHTVALWTAVSP